MSSSILLKRLAIFFVITVMVIVALASRAEAGLKFQSLEIPEGEMKLMDLDGDGLNDIVLFSASGLFVFWHYPGEGFKEKRDVFIPGDTFMSEAREDFTIADLNNDGLLDIVRAGESNLSIFFQKPGRIFPPVSDQRVSFPVGTWLVDIGNVSVAPGLEIITMSDEGVIVRAMGEDGLYGKPQKMLDDTLYLASVGRNLFARRRWPCPWNFCLDANGDGLDDIFIPQLDKVLLIIQEPQGVFEKRFNLKMPVIVEVATGPLSGESLTSLASTRTPYLWTGLQAPSIEVRDINGDGRPDVVLGEVFGYLQDANGNFPESDNHPTERIRTNERQPKDVLELVNEYVDVNGDGIIDRVSQYRPWSTGAMKSDVKIWFGDGKRNLFDIDPDKDRPDNKVVGENFLFEAQLVDLDGDGALDILMFDTDYKITEVANWVQINQGRIKGEVKVYFFDKRNNFYSNKWSFVKPLMVNYEIRTFEIFQNRIFDYVQTMMTCHYDFTGNGKKDLMVRQQSDAKEDWVFIYENSGRRNDLFPERPTARIRTPKFHYFRILDINSDGVNDFVLYDSSDRRVGILLSYYTKGL